MREVLVAGAGVSGVSVASLMQERGLAVTVYEKEPGTGGLVRCTREEGVLFHRVGGHVFNTRDKRVGDWFWSKFDRATEFKSAKRNAQILLGDRFVAYPIENNLYQLPHDIVRSVIADFLKLGGDAKPSANFQEFLLSRFGRTLFDLYFNPYNQKLWKMDLALMPLEWLEGKLPMPDIPDVLLQNIMRESELEMIHSSFYYPESGGSQFIIDRLAAGLNIRSNTSVNDIFLADGCITVNGSERFDALVYTGDVRDLYRIIKNPSPDLAGLLQGVVDFRSNGTTNVLCESPDFDFSWLYLPSPDYQCHRIINTGSFSASNTPQGMDGSCVLEFSGLYADDFVFSELKKLPFNLRPIAVNRQESSYVLHDFEVFGKLEKLRAVLKSQGIYLLGRFAEWQYFNMDKAMESAFRVFDEIAVD